MAAASAVADQRLDRIFQALANRTRRRILAILKRGPAKVTDLARPFGISLNAVSKHLLVLERAGLIGRTITGRVHSCRLKPRALMQAEQWIAEYEALWSEKLDAFADYVENTPD